MTWVWTQKIVTLWLLVDNLSLPQKSIKATRKALNKEFSPPLQHKPPYCNICLGMVPKCVAGVPNLLHFPRRPASKRSLYSVFRSPRLLATAVRQFLFLFPSFVRSQLCSPLPLQMPPFESCVTVRVVRNRGSRPGTQPPPPAGQVRPASRPHGTYEQQRTQSALHAMFGRCGGDNLPRPSAGQSTPHPPYLQIDRF
jgi:hypothetical protein